MRVLLSAIGSRGEVQPVGALALQLKALGHDVDVHVSPDFCEWLDALGIPATPLGPAMRPGTKPGWNLSTPEGRRHAAEEAVAAQFATLPEAARGCDVLMACGAVLVAGRSASELAGTRYIHVHYCPTTLPSPHHAPARWPGWPQDLTGDHQQLWERDAQRWNNTWRAVLNAHRAQAGLPPVEDARSHVLGDRPLLAADPALAPWPDTGDPEVIQTGAWILPDERPLPAELEYFLAVGEAPIYFGLGSTSSLPDGISKMMINVARALGRRALISSGWAGLQAADDTADCLVIGEVNHQALFRRVAAVVHHGGAGTTTAAARAGTAQVILPQVYDQHYWAQRVDHLGIGIAHPQHAPTEETLTNALRRALEPDVRAQARTAASSVRTDGTKVAARHLADGNRALT